MSPGLRDFRKCVSVARAVARAIVVGGVVVGTPKGVRPREICACHDVSVELCCACCASINLRCCFPL